MTNEELIARLEAATGPDREADLAIAVMWGGYVLEKRGRDKKAWLYHSDGRWRRDPDKYWSYDGLPSYTGSVDAILALVKYKQPDAYIEISGPRKYLGIPTPVPNFWRAAIMAGPDIIGWGATAPLAFCIALFRALQHQEASR